MKSYCLGIDLGTTNTVGAAWVQGDARPEVFPIEQPWRGAKGLRERHELLESALTIHEGRYYVGKWGRQLASREPRAQSFRSIKRMMGRHWFRMYDDVGWTPERVSACILSVVRDQAIARFGCEPERVVVTIPASFGTEARRATLVAARMAGFDPATLSLFDEPTAAFLSEVNGGQAWPFADDELHAIVDIGGGTLDCSIVRIEREGPRTVFDVLGQSRYNELAGDDFDLSIAGYLLHLYERDTGPLEGMSDSNKRLVCVFLLEAAQGVKVKLAQASTGQMVAAYAGIRDAVHLPPLFGRSEWRAELSAVEMAACLREYFPPVQVGASADADRGFFGPITECLAVASKVAGEEISAMDLRHVWLTGGSGQLPLVSMAVQRLLSQKPQPTRSPLLAVAQGAAWKAGLDAGYTGEQFELRERLLDAIHLETAPKTYRELVPARSLVPQPTRVLDGALVMPATHNVLELALFRGDPPDAGPMLGADVAWRTDLVPLCRRRITFSRIVEAGTPLVLSVSLTASRELVLSVSCTVDGRQITSAVEVSTSMGWESEESEFVLPALNQELRP